jgi:hypothetical protein
MSSRFQAGLVVLLIHTSSMSNTPPEGVYAITVCHGPCASEPQRPTKLQGALVLLSEPVPDNVVKALGPAVYGHKAIEGRPNGCFRLGQYRDFGGNVLREPLESAELVHWSLEGDEIVVNLFRTPDAGYVIRTKVGVEVRGSGGRWPKDHDPIDEVVGRRIASASSSTCDEPSRLTWP